MNIGFRLSWVLVAQNISLVPLLLIVTTAGLSPAIAGGAGIIHGLCYFLGPTARLFPVRILGLVIAAFAAGAAAVAGGWLLVVWLSMLIGMRMSQLLSSAATIVRLAALAEVLLLLLVLTLGPLASALATTADTEIVQAYSVIALAWALALALAIAAVRSSSLPRIEVIAATLFFLLTIVLSLSAALLVLLRVFPYGSAVLAALLVGEAICAAMWLAWSPLIGGGLSTVFFRHVLALGVPIDEWLGQMEEIVERKATAASFWSEALMLLVTRMRLNGVMWRSSEGSELELGLQKGYTVDLPVRAGTLRAYSRTRWMPTVIFNLWMLARAASEFHQAKQNEERRALEIAVRSAHEAGAKTTHDIKNLLHIIKLITEQTNKADSARRFAQLSKLAARIEDSIKQQTTPGVHATPGATMSAEAWWKGVQSRYADLGAEFLPAAADALAGNLPVQLFDTALENMIHNALRKKEDGNALRVTVQIKPGLALEVADNGAPVDPDIAARMFSVPIPSGQGMGIGLFQLASAARHEGWKMQLVANEPGNVRFRLARAGSMRP